LKLVINAEGIFRETPSPAEDSEARRGSRKETPGTNLTQYGERIVG